MNEDVTFETLPVPYSLGTVRFRPTIESIKKLGYGVDEIRSVLADLPDDDDSGTLLKVALQRLATAR